VPEGWPSAIKREGRKKLSADALVKFQKSTTEGLTQKFTLMTHSTDDELVECYNLSMRIETLKLRLEQTNIIGGFDIFETSVFAFISTDPMSKEVSVIDRHEFLSEALVWNMQKFKHYFGQTYDVQDLQWSQDLLEIFCQEDFRIKVLEKM
jgi:hypothetical protein